MGEQRSRGRWAARDPRSEVAHVDVEPLEAAGRPAVEALQEQAIEGRPFPYVKQLDRANWFGATRWAEPGGRPLHTEYPDVGHNVFMWAHTEPALVEWLFAQHR